MANTTWSPTDKSASITLSGGNLTATASASLTGLRAADRQATGKFYFEFTMGTTITSSYVGMVSSNAALGTSSPADPSFTVNVNGTIFVNNVSTLVQLGTRTTGDIYGVAVDLTARLFWIRVAPSGNWNANAAASPATGVGGLAFTGGIAYGMYPWAYFNAAGAFTANFGDSAFSGAVPSGFTSGFPAGASVPTSAIATQAALEQWNAPSPQGQVTQVAIEEWGVPNPAGQVTQIGVEHWGTVATTTDQYLVQVLLTDTDTFFVPFVGSAGGPQTLTPSLVTDADTIQAPQVALTSDGYWSNVVLLTGGNPVPTGTATTTWSPADLSGVTLSGGNLIATGSAGGGVRAVGGKSSGQYYWEYTVGTCVNANTAAGVGSATANLNTVGPTPTQAALVYKSGGIWVNNTNSGFSLAGLTTGTVIGVALDLTNQKIWFRAAPSGNWNGSGTADPTNPSTGISISALTGALYPLFSAGNTGEAATANFGASAFTGTVPSGFTSGWLSLSSTLNFIDESQYAHTLTPSGNVRIDTAQSKFGGSSLLFDGSGDYVSSADSADWDFGSGQFTVEAWICLAATSQNWSIVSQWDATADRAWALFSSNGSIYFRADSGGSLYDASFTQTLTAGQWYHLAADRDATGKLRIYLDGVMNRAVAAAVAITNCTKPLLIGSVFNTAGLDFNGWIDELRITKGVARYASDTGFTVPAAAFPRGAGGPSGQTLLPTFVTDADSFPVPVVAGGAATLSAALVTDADTVFAPTLGRGAVTLSAGLVTDADSFFAPGISIVSGTQTLSPTLVSDGDVFYPPVAAVFGGLQTLLPGLVVDSDAFYAPTVAFPNTQTLRPSLVVDTEAVPGAYSIDAIQPGHKQQLHAPFLISDDVIPLARLSLSPMPVIDTDTIFAVITQWVYPLRPSLLPSDDAVFTPSVSPKVQPALFNDADSIFRPLITLFLVPQVRILSDDAIPIANVGWKVFAKDTQDVDQIYPPRSQAWNYIRPDTWEDEEHIDTYPFFIQGITGGIPVPPPEGVLIGEVSDTRILTGTVSPGSSKILTGSLANDNRRKVLTGSLRHLRAS